MLAVIVAAAIALQGKAPAPEPLSVEESYDRVRDEGKSALTIGRVYTAPEAWMPRVDMELSHTWAGLERKPLAPTDRVRLVVSCSAKEWTFRDRRDLAILAGAERFRSDEADRWTDVVTEYIDERRVRDLGNGKALSTVVPVAVNRCKERLTYEIALGDLRRIVSAGAARTDVTVGDLSWGLNGPQVEAVRRWAESMAVTPEEARAAELEASRARNEAMAAARARLDPYREAVKAAVEKARAAGRSVPKKQYATTGEKLKWRTFDREIEAVVKKHGLKPKDVEELLQDYPDFKARNKIR